MDNAPDAWKLSAARMRMPMLALLLSMLGSSLGVAAAASVEPPAAEAVCRLGEMDEERGDFDRAVDHDLACAAAAPGTRWAVRATERADWLRARSEGGFAPLSRLERVRRSPSLASDPGAIDALAREAASFPPGIVRIEARMLVAEAWLGRLGRPRDAVPLLREVARDPRADPLTAGLAERELIGSLTADGAVEEAAAEARANADLLDPRFVRGTERLVRRRWVRWAALAVLAAYAGLAAIAIERARRRQALVDMKRAVRVIAPVAVPFAAFLGLGGGMLASRYESGNAQPFLLLATAALPLALVSRAWGAVGSSLRAARVGRALLCSATVFAAAFVLLDVVSPDYLEGFGL